MLSKRNKSRKDETDRNRGRRVIKRWRVRRSRPVWDRSVLSPTSNRLLIQMSEQLDIRPVCASVRLILPPASPSSPPPSPPSLPSDGQVVFLLLFLSQPHALQLSFKAEMQQQLRTRTVKRDDHVMGGLMGEAVRWARQRRTDRHRGKTYTLVADSGCLSSRLWFSVWLAEQWSLELQLKKHTLDQQLFDSSLGLGVVYAPQHCLSVSPNPTPAPSLLCKVERLNDDTPLVQTRVTFRPLIRGITCNNSGSSPAPDCRCLYETFIPSLTRLVFVSRSLPPSSLDCHKNSNPGGCWASSRHHRRWHNL